MKGSRLLTRREALGAVSAAGAALAFGCGDSPTSPSSTTTSTTTTTTSTNTACAVTPTETIGPYPSLVDLFRSDIREGKNGTLLALTIRVVNASSGCAAVPNANVEIWHVDAAGDYSHRGRRRFCAAFKPPTATGKSRSPRSIQGGTRVVRHTSTSR